MNRRAFLCAPAVLAASTVPAAGPIASPSLWPTRALRIWVGFPPGSTPDAVARTLADTLPSALGQPVVVENRPGASGNLAAQMVAQARDDHTLGVVINGNLTTAKRLQPNLPFDPARDFSLLSLLTTAPLALVTQASKPAGSAFRRAAIESAEQWSYGSVGSGSMGHLGMELLRARLPGFRPVHIPYSGNPAVLTALLSGQIDLALMPPGLVQAHQESGRLRVIGLTAGRSILAPQAPALAEVGFPALELEVWTALVGPSRLPAAARERLFQWVPRLLREPQPRERLFRAGWQVAATAPDALSERVQRESARMRELLQTVALDPN